MQACLVAQRVQVSGGAVGTVLQISQRGGLSRGGCLALAALGGRGRARFGQLLAQFSLHKTRAVLQRLQALLRQETEIQQVISMVI